MNDLARYFGRTFHHRRLSNSAGAIAGLTSGMSILVGLIAAHYAPHGLHRLSIALHLSRQPMIMKLAPFVAGIAAAFATAAGIARFYSWCKEHEEESR